MPMWLISRQLTRNESIVGRAADYKSAGKSHADVAQLAEQLICNQQVIGSSPIIGFYNRIIIAVKVLNSYEYSIIWMDSRVAKGDRL